MKFVLPSFDPSATTSGSVTLPLPTGMGSLIIRNDSGVNLIFTFNNDNVRVLAQTAERVVLCVPTFTITWKQETILSNSANVPISLVLIDAYTPEEPVPSTYPFSIPRVANVGNAVSTTSSNSVIVSGETPPNDLVKSSPTGYTHSTIDIRDDGTITVYGLDNNVEKLLFQIAPSASVAVKIALLSTAIGSSGQLTVDESGNLVTTGTASTGALTMTKIASSDSGKVKTDGSGNETVASITANAASGNTVVAGSSGQATIDYAGNIVTTGTASTGALTATKIASADGGAISTDGSGNETAKSLTVNAATGNTLIAGSAGQLTIDHAGNLSSTGIVTAYQATYINSATAETANDHFGFPTSEADGKIIRCGVTFAGNSSGTFTHGWGGLQNIASLTPTWCGITENVSGNTMTVGVDSLGQTTVHVDVGVTGTNWIGFVVRT